MDIKTSLVSKLNEYFVSNSVNTKLGTDIMSMLSENNTDCLKIFPMPLYKDRLFCRQLFSDIKDSCLTEYIKNGTESIVQCRECRRWNNTDDSHNACCGDDNEHGLIVEHPIVQMMEMMIHVDGIEYITTMMTMTKLKNYLFGNQVEMY